MLHEPKTTTDRYSTMKKVSVSIASLMLVSMLAACSKPADSTAEQPASAGDSAAAAPAVSEAEKNYQEGLRLLAANDLGNAVNLLLKSSSEGHAAAKFELAKLYQEGKGVEKNAGEATNLLLASADAGNAQAAYELATMYESGEGIEKNEGEALNLYLKAGQAGSSEAALKLGDVYQEGKGVPANAGEAKSWYQKAAEAGNTQAAEKLKALEAK